MFLEDPFWVGILEISDDDGVRAARHVFGDEPSGPELYAFGLSRDYERLCGGAPGRAPSTAALATIQPAWVNRVAASERDTGRRGIEPVPD